MNQKNGLLNFFGIWDFSGAEESSLYLKLITAGGLLPFETQEEKSIAKVKCNWFFSESTQQTKREREREMRGREKEEDELQFGNTQ